MKTVNALNIEILWDGCYTVPMSVCRRSVHAVVCSVQHRSYDGDIAASRHKLLEIDPHFFLLFVVQSLVLLEIFSAVRPCSQTMHGSNQGTWFRCALAVSAQVMDSTNPT